jgi:predicted nucleic acid-binding protein
MKYLIDTNILIDHLRGEAKEFQFLKKVENRKIVAFISIITEYEILCGKFSKKEEQAINELLLLFPSINITSEIVKQAANFHKKYQTNIADALIAGTAYCFHCVLITRNLKHFQKIKEITVESI